MSLERAIKFKLAQDTSAQSIGPQTTGQTVDRNSSRITYKRVDSDHAHTLSGNGAGSASALIQIDCHSTSYEDAVDLGEEVRLSLQGFNGLMGDTGKQVLIQSCFLESTDDENTPPSDGSDRSTHTRTMEFTFWYVESVPVHA